MRSFWRNLVRRRRPIYLVVALMLCASATIYEVRGQSIRNSEIEYAKSTTNRIILDAKNSKELNGDWKVDILLRENIYEGHEGGLGIRVLLYCKTDQPDRAIKAIQDAVVRYKVPIRTGLLWYTHDQSISDRLELLQKHGAVVALDFPASPTNICEHFENGI